MSWLFTLRVEEDAVVTAKDVGTIYELPLVLHSEGLDDGVVQRLNIWTAQPQLQEWERVVSVLKNPDDRVRIAMVGKYVDLTESYKSLNEALAHAGISHGVGVEIEQSTNRGDRTGEAGDLLEFEGRPHPGGILGIGLHGDDERRSVGGRLHPGGSDRDRGRTGSREASRCESGRWKRHLREHSGRDPSRGR